MRDDLAAPPSRIRSPFLGMRLSLLGLVAIGMFVGIVIALSRPVGDHDHAHRFPPPPPNPGDGFADVAGDYYQGDGRGRNWSLKILPDGRYSFLWSGCLGVYHRESGAASRSGEDLVLSPLKPIGPPMERTFLPIRWGRRSYLVPTGEIQEFCDAIIRGDEPRDEIRGRFYVLGDEAPASGVPELPEEWAAYLRENMVIGTITDVTATGRARVDVGSEDGVRVGSLLTARRRDGLVDSSERQFRTVLVNTNSCEIEPLYPVPRKRPIEPGWELIAERESRRRARAPDASLPACPIRGGPRSGPPPATDRHALRRRRFLHRRSADSTTHMAIAESAPCLSRTTSSWRG